MQFAATFALPEGTPMRNSAGGSTARLFVAGLCGLADVVEAFRSRCVDSDMM
jgi:hypothetical protein